MIYKRKKSPYWYVAFYVKNAAGKHVMRAVSTKTEDRQTALEIEEQLTAAKRELAQKKRLERFLSTTAEIATAKTIERQGIAIDRVWTSFMSDSSQAKRTERTMQSKRNAWEAFRIWLKENYPEANDIQDVSREMACEYMKRFNSKSGSTFNNNKNCLSNIWQVLMIPAAIKENIWRLVHGAENDSVSYRHFSIDEVKHILSSSSGFWHHATFISFYTGLRLKDVVYLNRSQIKNDYISLIPAKTARKRKSVYIYMHPALKEYIDKLISNLAPEDDYLFKDAIHDYGKKEFHSRYTAILTSCDIKDNNEGIVGFHSLRHTFVTINEERGVDRKVIQGIVGHGSPVMTGHYSHDKESVKILAQMPTL